MFKFFKIPKSILLFHKLVECCGASKKLLVASFTLSLVLIPVEISFIDKFSSVLGLVLGDKTFVRDGSEVYTIFAYILTLFLLRITSNCISAMIVYNFSTSIESSINHKIISTSIDKISEMGNEHYRSLLLMEVNNAVGGVVKPMLNSAISIMTVIPIFLYILLVSPKLLLQTFAILMLTNIAAYSAEKKCKENDSEAIDRMPQVASKRLDEFLENPEIVRITGKSGFIYKRLESAQRKYRFAIARNLAFSTNSRPIIEVSCYVSIVIFACLMVNSSEGNGILQFSVGSSRIVGPLGVIAACKKTVSAYRASAIKIVEELS